MALELKLQEAQNVNVGQDLQGFVCLSWKSPFQKYIDNCFLTSKLLKLTESILFQSFRILSRIHFNNF